jgi:hypothetical protein
VMLVVVEHSQQAQARLVKALGYSLRIDGPIDDK